MLVMLEAADEMVALATRWEPEGMLEVLEGHKHLPDVLRRVGDAVKILHRNAQERYPLHPAVIDTIEGVVRNQLVAAQYAEEIAPGAYALHRREIEALQDPRNAMWDVRANHDSAPASRPAPAPQAPSE